MGILSQAAKRLRVALGIRTSEPIVSTFARGFLSPGNDDSYRVGADQQLLTESGETLFKVLIGTPTNAVNQSVVMSDTQVGDKIIAVIDMTNFDTLDPNGWTIEQSGYWKSSASNGSNYVGTNLLVFLQRPGKYAS